MIKKFWLIIIAFVCLTFATIHYISNSISFIEIISSNDYQIVEEIKITPIVFTLDMENMRSNVNKIIYADEDCNIKIQSFKLLPNNQYDIIFSTNGKFNKNGGIIFTGNSYIDMLNHEPKLYTENNTYWYLSSIHRLAKNNGDYFGFSIDKSQIIGNKIILNLDGIIKITIIKNENQ